MRAVAILVLLCLPGAASCAVGGSSPDGEEAADAGPDDAAGSDDGAAPDGEPAGEGVDAPLDPAADEEEAAECPGTGPAYVHGDLWAFWYNFRVACSAQHRWAWICEQRLGEGSCPVETRRFEDCWSASGDFPPSTWDGSTPAPSSPNYGVCQPVHWAEKNDPERRPGNTVPCDVTTYDYGALRTADPFFGVDWWGGGITSMRHLTLKVFEAGSDPYADNGQSDGIVNLSTHPENSAAFMDGLSNHSYPGHVRPGGCLPGVTGETEDPYPDQNFGAFFWLEVPTDRPVTVGATWIGPIGDDIGLSCLNMDIWGFPPGFAEHAVDGKPWFTTSPCWDILESVSFEPGRHYVWDIRGLRPLPGCGGPPEDLLSVVPETERASFRDGTCSSM